MFESIARANNVDSSRKLNFYFIKIPKTSRACYCDFTSKMKVVINGEKNYKEIGWLPK